MNLPQINIGNKTSRVPIIQGGMGVGVSLSSLSSAVANAGGIGIISGAQIGFREDDFDKNTNEANLRALSKEIRRARSLSPHGIIGVNLMVATREYKALVKHAAAEDIDLIISGAGLPLDLPDLVKGTDTKIAPIVSSGKAAALITKVWLKRYKYLPDLIIVEGPDAGGHLGFALEDLEKNPPKLEDLVHDVLKAIKPYEEANDKVIPVIAAGGIYDGKDIRKFLNLGASGVQMGTRFVATEECDVSDEFKQAYINCKKEDIDYILSPVGMPGQAIINPFMHKVEVERQRAIRCYKCLTPCKPATTPYCISQALINSAKGHIDNGLIFVGKNGYRVNKILKVKDLINELVSNI